MLEYELASDVYRRKFRTGVKRQGDMFGEFAEFLTITFNRWLNAVQVNDVDGVKEMMLLEKFYEQIAGDVRLYLVDR